MTQDVAKKAAARKALQCIRPGMIVGLGSGSTASLFIQLLAEEYRRGLKVETVASSHSSATLAQQGGLPVLDINDVPHIDLTIDGADEVDPQKRLIKGGGGAHVREKILASSSREMVVIVDPSKLVSHLGRGKLPVEILFYGAPTTRTKIEKLGYKGKWRKDEGGALFMTENGNLLFDISWDTPPPHPEQDEKTLRSIPGVLDTGFFFGLANRIIVGHPDGHTDVM